MWDPGYKKVKNWTKGVRISQEIGYENREMVRGRNKDEEKERDEGRWREEGRYRKGERDEGRWIKGE